MILSFLGLVLVLSKNVKQRIDSLLSLLCTLAFAPHERAANTWIFSIFRTEHLAASDAGMVSAPLRI